MQHLLFDRKTSRLQKFIATFRRVSCTSTRSVSRRTRALPKTVLWLPPEILWPRDTWGDVVAYDAAAKKLASLFRDNFKLYENGADADVRDVAPAISV
jgi:ATP-dependent phosphoenolpyruvate carboxykinase